MKKLFCFAIAATACLGAFTQSVTLSKAQLLDKIKGGWAGQTIGVTFGGPYEFHFLGSFIGDEQRLNWYNGYLAKTMRENPGLYDDLYMDLTFVDVYEKYGLDAPLDSFASAYANAGYVLWHANQAGRYNILNGIKAPQSGHWLNNPHADCIDYQIESDFAGLMSPGMPNTASAISDKIGHIMNYGDGWYGGVFVGAMYSLAFVHNDIPTIVNQALKTIPASSKFYRCIADVIAWHKKYPTDWKQTWMEVQRKWSYDVGCPDGVNHPFNIDATVNAAYVVIGLLYGNGDYTRTLEITTRCGQDADCNPSTAGGVLGTMIGYNRIPAYWKQGLAEAESIDFKYTTMSLNRVYETGFKHALENIGRNGGKVSGDQVTLAVQQPKAVRLEQSFLAHHPQYILPLSLAKGQNELSFEFEGDGFVIKGNTAKWMDANPGVAKAELYIDGKLAETAALPASYTTRRYDIAWKYQLPEGKHQVKWKLLSTAPGQEISVDGVVIYSSRPPKGIDYNRQMEAAFGK